MSSFCLLLDCQTLKITTQKRKHAQGKERYVKNGLLPTKRKNFSNKSNTFNDHLQYLKIVITVWPWDVNCCNTVVSMASSHSQRLLQQTRRAFKIVSLSLNVQHIFLQAIWIIFNDEIKSGPWVVCIEVYWSGLFSKFCIALFRTTVSNMRFWHTVRAASHRCCEMKSFSLVQFCGEGVCSCLLLKGDLAVAAQVG